MLILEDTGGGSLLLRWLDWAVDLPLQWAADLSTPVQWQPYTGSNYISNGEIRTVVSMKLLGDKNVRLVLDTGFYQYADGMLPPDMLRPALQNRTAKTIGRCPGLGYEVFFFESIDVGGERYKGLSFAEVPIKGGEVEGFIGLTFIERHVATFDFPRGVMYLRSTSAKVGSGGDCWL